MARKQKRPQPRIQIPAGHSRQDASALIARRCHDKVCFAWDATAGERRLRVFTFVLAIVLISFTADAVAPAARHATLSADGDLKLVVALFSSWRPRAAARLRRACRGSREGRLAGPGEGLACPPDGWGDLTPAGTQRRRPLAPTMRATIRRGRRGRMASKAYLWADAEDERTRETAQALARGLRGPTHRGDGRLSLCRKVAPIRCFIPSRRAAARPMPARLGKIAADINRNWTLWRLAQKSAFRALDGVLACSNKTPDASRLRKARMKPPHGQAAEGHRHRSSGRASSPTLRAHPKRSCSNTPMA